MPTRASIEQDLQVALPSTPPEVVARVVDLIWSYLQGEPAASLASANGRRPAGSPESLVSQAVLAIGPDSQLGDVQIGTVVREIINVNLGLGPPPPATAPAGDPPPRLRPPARLPELVEIPAGPGAGQGSFLIGRRPVTQAEYALFVHKRRECMPQGAAWPGVDPPRGASSLPVIGVSWCDARAYCAWLREATGRAYRLPSAAEWRLAAAGDCLEAAAGLVETAEGLYEWTATIQGDEGASDAPWAEGGDGPGDIPLGHDVVCCKGPAGASKSFPPTTKDARIGFRVAVGPAPPSGVDPDDRFCRQGADRRV